MKPFQIVFLACFWLFSSCRKENIPANPASPLIEDLQCDNASSGMRFLPGNPISDTLLIAYLGGNATSFPAGDTLFSTGISGLKARILAGTLVNGNGSLKLAVWGNPDIPGYAEIPLSFAGKSCILRLKIEDPDTLAYGIPFREVPERQDAIIYQVNMRVFSQAGNFQGVIDRLDSIKKLGTNVLYLMPFYTSGVFRAINSPYCVRSYREINPEFGNLQQLRNLVDAAHQRGLAVMLDWVANHTAWDHEWMSSHPDWYLRDASGNVLIPPGTNWQDVVQLDFSRPAMRLEMIRSMKYWIYQANVDGFRCDYADGPPFDFWRQAVDSLRKIPDRKLLLLAEGSRNNHFVAGFDFTFGFNFFNTLKGIYFGSTPLTNLPGINYSEFSASGNRQQVVRYTSNHDVNGSDGTPLELFKGIEGSLGAFAIASLMKGIPMLYGGQEVGTPYRLTFPFTGSNINWSLNPALPDRYRKIIAFRKNSAAIRLAEPQMFSTADVLAFSKEWMGEKVLVLVNVRNSNKQISIPAAFANQIWTDALSGNQLSITDTYTLAPLASLILKSN